jgi:two-component system sensor histidine kinase UhpB
VAGLKSQANDILENLHRLAIDLRPASLDHVGLVGALRQYTQTFSEQHDLPIQFEVVGLDERRLSTAVETNLYRIVQEALTNVVRHAKASRIDVLLERRGDQLITIIEDDGIGFDLRSAGQNSRLGLVGMRERAEMLDGTLMVESNGDTGTTIFVEVPYVHSDNLS